MRPSARMSWTIVGALAVLLMSAAPALAKSKDANHNKIPDKWELKYHFSIKKNLANEDADKDGLTNRQEYLTGTNPLKKDTNGNGIADPKEDADKDGLVNIEEFRAKTNPRVKDTNHNGISDAKEDPDKDRLSNAAEYKCRTNPLSADTNKDGTSDFNSDPDKDGLDNGAEIAEGCNPWNSDSDHDGTIDGLEVAGFVTSFDATSGVLSVTALNDSECTFEVNVGDTTNLSWNAVVSRDGSPTVDDLKAGAIVTNVEGQVQADGTVLATSIVLIPAADTASLVAMVSWYDSEGGWLSLVPAGGGDEYSAKIDDATTFAWAAGAYSGHAASADDLNEGVGVTEIDVKYNADGDIVIKNIVLVPNYASSGHSWDNGSGTNNGDGSGSGDNGGSGSGDTSTAPQHR